jgi:hypothetical protein
MSVSPCLYLGLNSVQIGIEIEKLSNKLNNPSSNIKKKKNSIYVVDSTAKDQFIGYDILKLEGNSLSWLDEEHCECNIYMIIDKVRLILEDLDFSSLQTIKILSDLTMRSGLPSIITQYISDLFPGISIVSIFIMPPIPEKLHGIDTFEAIKSFQTAFEISDGVMIRGLDDIYQLITTESGTNSPKHNDLQINLASDLFISFSRGIYNHTDLSCTSSLFPLDVCSTSHKLFDVRTSLWRTLKRPTKGGSQYNPLRAMASNLHALHLTTSTDKKHYESSLPSNEINNTVFTTLNSNSMLSNIINSATLVDIIPDLKNKSGGKFNILPTLSTAYDVSVALDWACPHTKWPDGLGTAAYRDISTGLISKGGGNNLIINQSLSSSSSQSLIGKKDNNIKNSISLSETYNNVNQSKISAISFQSPYASFYVKNLCSKTKLLLDMKAFSNIKRNTNVIHEFDLIDSLESVINYIN